MPRRRGAGRRRARVRRDADEAAHDRRARADPAPEVVDPACRSRSPGRARRAGRPTRRRRRCRRRRRATTRRDVRPQLPDERPVALPQGGDGAPVRADDDVRCRRSRGSRPSVPGRAATRAPCRSPRPARRSRPRSRLTKSRPRQYVGGYSIRSPMPRAQTLRRACPDRCSGRERLRSGPPPNAGQHGCSTPEPLRRRLRRPLHRRRVGGHDGHGGRRDEASLVAAC